MSEILNLFQVGVDTQRCGHWAAAFIMNAGSASTEASSPKQALDLEQLELLIAFTNADSLVKGHNSSSFCQTQISPPEWIGQPKV